MHETDFSEVLYIIHTLSSNAKQHADVVPEVATVFVSRFGPGMDS